MDVKLKINGRHLIFIGKEPEFGRRAADYVAGLKKWRPGDEVETHELPSEDRAGYVRRAVAFGKPILTLTFFCHGTRNTLAGTINRAGARAIGAALRENAAPGAAVGLFSCLTGHDSDGLAGSLHAGTGGKIPVLAHASASHGPTLEVQEGSVDAWVEAGGASADSSKEDVGKDSKK